MGTSNSGIAGNTPQSIEDCHALLAWMLLLPAAHIRTNLASFYGGLLFVLERLVDVAHSKTVTCWSLSG